VVSARPSVVLNRVLQNKGNFGFNAQTEKFGDLFLLVLRLPSSVVNHHLTASYA